MTVRRPGPVVVLVFSHRDPPQVHRLIDRVRDGDDVFVAVHHDPQSEPLTLPSASNVAQVPHARHCPWGQPEITLALWDSLRWVADTVPELAWVLLVSGQDYPAMPMKQLEHELRTTPHDAFIRQFRLDDDPALDVHHWQALARRRYYRRRRLPYSARSFPWPRRHPFVNGRHAYAGDLWYNLGADAVRHVVDNVAWAERLLRFSRGAANADELLVPSLVMNDQNTLDVVNDRRRYVRFTPGAAHPATLGASDVPDILASNAFFARKFSADAPEVLDLLD
jgi:hypothetical protein